MSMFSCPDHPDVAAALSTGYPAGSSPDNRDSEQYRDEYIAERIKEFLFWMKHGDQDVLDRFFEEHKRDYRNWLN